MSTLTLTLDDEVSDGIDRINESIDSLGARSEDAAKGANVLTDAQQRQAGLTDKLANSLVNLNQVNITTFGDLNLVRMERAAAAQEKQIVLTEKHESAVKRLGMVAAEVSVGKMFSDGIDAAETAAKRFLQVSAAMGVYAAAKAKLYAQSQAGKEAIADFVVDKGIEAGVQHVIKAVTGLALEIGPPIAGATLTLGALEVALANTGKTAGGTFEKMLRQTHEQSKAFDEFSARARSLKVSVDSLAKTEAAKAGIEDVGTYLEKTFGIEKMRAYESNLDRVNEALGKLGGAVRGDFVSSIEAGKQAMADWWGQKFDWTFGWGPDINVMVTRNTDQFLENLKRVEGGYKSASAYGQAFLAVAANKIGATNDNRSLGDQKADIDRENAATAQRNSLNNQRSREGNSFDNLAATNQSIADRKAKRLEEERIAKLKTVADVDKERQALTERMSDLANQGSLTTVAEPKRPEKFKDDKEKEAFEAKLASIKSSNEKAIASQKLYVEQSEALDKRAAEIPKEEAKRKTESLKAQREAQEAHNKAMNKLADEEIKRFKDVAEAVKKRNDTKESLDRGVMKEVSNAQSETAFASLKDQLSLQKDITAEKMRANGLQTGKDGVKVEAEIKTKLRDMDKQFADALHADKISKINEEFKEQVKLSLKLKADNERALTDSVTKAKQEQKRLEDLDKQQADQKKKLIAENARYQREQDQANIDAARQAEFEKFALTKARIEKEKAIQDEALKQNFKAEAFAGGVDQKKLLKQIQDDRAAKEMAIQAQKDQGLFEKAKGKGGDKQAEAEYLANEKAAYDKSVESTNKKNYKLKSKADGGDAEAQAQLKELQEADARKALELQGKKDAGLRYRASGERPDLVRQYEQNQEAAGRRGRQSAENDFQSGTLPQGEVAGAAGKLATATIQAANAQGKVNDANAKIMIDAVQTLATQQQSINDIQKMLAQLAEFQKGIKTAAQKNQQQFQSQVGGQQL